MVLPLTSPQGKEDHSTRACHLWQALIIFSLVSCAKSGAGISGTIIVSAQLPQEYLRGIRCTSCRHLTSRPPGGSFRNIIEQQWLGIPASKKPAPYTSSPPHTIKASLSFAVYRSCTEMRTSCAGLRTCVHLTRCRSLCEVSRPPVVADPKITLTYCDCLKMPSERLRRGFMILTDNPQRHGNGHWMMHSHPGLFGPKSGTALPSFR